LISYGPGDTAQPQVWLDLESELAAWRPSLAAIDAGYNTSMVLDFCAKRAWCVPVKGVFGVGRPLIEDERRRKARLRTRRKRGQPIEPLGVDQGKSLLYGRLKMVKPGPGFVHFPAEEAFDDEYFLQLTAEELVKRARSGRTFMEWKKIRPRNEALDCWIYALAACRLAGPLVERTPAPYRAQEAKNDALPPAVIHGIQPAEETVAPTPTPPPTRKKRAVSQRSGGSFQLRY
jgi:phage terminase large subunit GpA-like protein